jgi:hypothetical protein
MDSVRFQTAIANAIAEARRAAFEEAASLIQDMPMAQILLAGGAMTAQERRTVKAVQGYFAHCIRELTRRSHGEGKP